jgi:hypothetical protein
MLREDLKVGKKYSFAGYIVTFLGFCNKCYDRELIFLKIEGEHIFHTNTICKHFSSKAVPFYADTQISNIHEIYNL